MKILKFGGSSVKTEQSLKNVLQIIKNETSQNTKIIVVCSALGGATNQLIDLAEKAENGKIFVDEFQNLEQEHFKLIKSLIPVSIQNQILMKVKIMFNEIEELLFSVKSLNELSPRIKDLILSFGERLSSEIIAAYLNSQNIPAEFTDARTLITTDSKFGQAIVNEEKTQENIKNWYQNINEKTPVVTGFIASDEQKRTTTLGRGGSDFTAALFGKILSAEKIEIWTDVDGFMTADPRIVKNAHSLEELSYLEAMELSYFGAKVIYPPTMIPAITNRIPVVIKNTFNPSHIGTIIHENAKKSNSIIRGIASISKVCMVNIEGNGMVGVKGFSGRLFTALGNQGINVILITQASSEHSISFAIIPEDAESTVNAIQNEFQWEIESKKLNLPQLLKNTSILAIVGENMRHTKGLSGKLFSALGRSGINVIATAQGSTELNLSVVITQEDLSKALNAVHDAMFLSPVKTYHVLAAGTGNIGKELFQQILLADKKLETVHRIKIKLIGITNTRKMILEKEGIDLETWGKNLDENGNIASFEEFLNQALSFNLPNLVFIDNTSSNIVVEKYTELFNHNISVVASNKIGNSGKYEQYLHFKNLTKQTGADFFYETNVGAGLPIIKTLQDLVLSGDEVIRLEAILSGTISYIFNQYHGDKTFAEVVQQAQDLGFTEPDPRDDLNGLDFSRKMIILGRELGLNLEMEEVVIDSILPEVCLNAPDIPTFYNELKNNENYFANLKEKAASENKKLRYIGILENGKVKISLEMVDASHPFYSLSGSDNIISITTSRYRNNPLVVKGPGAGAAVTATGVFADLMRVTSH